MSQTFTFRELISFEIKYIGVFMMSTNQKFHFYRIINVVFFIQIQVFSEKSQNSLKTLAWESVKLFEIKLYDEHFFSCVTELELHFDFLNIFLSYSFCIIIRVLGLLGQNRVGM